VHGGLVHSSALGLSVSAGGFTAGVFKSMSLFNLSACDFPLQRT